MGAAHTSNTAIIKKIQALIPRDNGHQFVIYGDSCSGVPGAPQEATFAAINAVVARLSPWPEFICFLGDEIRGLTKDDGILRSQWRYWLEKEMKWLECRKTPLYHTTGNHTTYNVSSEVIFREMLNHLPRNGPPGQVGLSYFVCCDELLLVFVNTNYSGLGGEGKVEIKWLENVLERHANVRDKLVLGHHPVYPVNGFSGIYQREIGPDNGRAFWQMLVKYGVLAYVCSHILAFDVQVHQGVLQITTAGAGTAHLMPKETEYHHCLQVALDSDGFRYQVLDISGRVREWLSWPIQQPLSGTWTYLETGAQAAPGSFDCGRNASQALFLAWRFSGTCSTIAQGQAQTLLAGWDPGPELAPIWIGLLGSENRLSVLLSPVPGRSPHLWHGPVLPPGEAFNIQVALHTGMGPGGILWREDDGSSWSSLVAASSWGAERLTWPSRWSIGQGEMGSDDRPFRGLNLQVQWYQEVLEL